MRRQFSNILCATDFSEFTETVVAYGVAMAGRFDATLSICHVIDLPTISAYGEAVFDPLEYQQRFMDTARHEINNLLSDAPVDYQELVTIGNTSDEIARQTHEHGVDLVITATHGRSGLKRFFLDRKSVG